MKVYSLVIFTVLAVQFCTSATVPEAEGKLQELRELTSVALEEANIEHARMSSEIDFTTLKIKNYGNKEVQKKIDRFLAKLKADKARNRRCQGSKDNIAEHLKQFHQKNLEKCVNKQGKIGVDVTSRNRLGISRHTWRGNYNEEKQIVECADDEECLERVVANIKDKIAEVRNVIGDKLKIKEHLKENQLEHIRHCATEAMTKVEFELSQIPTCHYEY